MLVTDGIWRGTAAFELHGLAVFSSQPSSCFLFTLIYVVQSKLHSGTVLAYIMYYVPSIRCTTEMLLCIRNANHSAINDV